MAALVLYYVVQPGIFQGKASGDGWFGFHYLKAIVFKHTLDMKEVLPQYVPYFGISGPGNHMPNRCPFGPVLLWLPFYLVGVALEWLLSLLHLVRPPSGDSAFLAWVTGLGTLAGVLVGWRYTFILIQRYCGRTAARVGATCAVWATPMAWYAATQPLYQHGLAFMTTAIVVERWDATVGDSSWRRMALLGAVGGLGMTMRGQEALWLLLPGLEAAWHVVAGPQRKQWLVAGLVLTAAALAAFAPQMAVWAYYTGSPFTPAQVEPLRLGEPFFSVALFSTRGGLFPWSPITYAALVGVLWVPRERALRVWAMVAIFVVEVWVIASAWLIWGGFGYGARRLSDGVVLLGLGVGLLWARVERVTWGRRAVAAFAGLCLVLNLWAMELVRERKVTSSGGGTRSAQRFLAEAKAPAAASRALGAVGYPFVQPFGWLFAWRWHAPVSAFENIVGTWFLDRDGQWRSVQTHTLKLNQTDGEPFVMSGLTFAPGEAPARVDGSGPVRLLLPMFAKERVIVHVNGRLEPGARAATWNGVTVPVRDERAGLVVDAPATAVVAGVNEVVLTVPAGSSLQRLSFESVTEWWKTGTR